MTSRRKPGTRAPRKHREWLRDELPELVRAQVLDRAAADRLTAYYALRKLRDRGNLLKLALALFGCSLVGAGVILLFAHNWSELSRPTRAVVSIGQLLFAQAGAGYALVRRAKSRPFIEGTAALLALSIGAAIALIAQTYNLGGDLNEFILVWIALTLPMLYVQRAKIIATFVLFAAPVVAFERTHDFDHGFLFFPILAAVVPALRPRSFASKVKGLTLLARWAFVIALPVGVFGVLVDPIDSNGSWPLVYAGLAAACVALGARLEHAHDTGMLRRAFSIAGSLGAIGLLLTLGYGSAVEAVADHATRSLGWVGSASYALAVFALAAAAALAPSLFRAGYRERPSQTLFAAMAAVVLLYAALRAGMGPDAVALAVGCLTLVLGCVLLALGIRERATGNSNRGISVLALLFLARFFDTDWSFLARGLGFLLLGLAFLGVNLFLSRQKRVMA